MEFHNDLSRVRRYMEKHGLVRGWNITPEVEQKINELSEICMSVYGRAAGDKRLVGWFPFADLVEKDGSATYEGHHADGFVIVPSSAPGDALIGIRQSLLMTAPMMYLVLGVGLHEVAHLRYDAHNDDFAQYLLYLQYDLAFEMKPNRC